MKRRPRTVLMWMTRRAFVEQRRRRFFRYDQVSERLLVEVRVR